MLPTSTPTSPHPLSLLHHINNNCTTFYQLKQIHAQALKTTVPDNPSTLFLFTRILHSSSSLDLDYAFRLFSQIKTPNSFSYNTLIRACARTKNNKNDAIFTYLRMLNDGNVFPDKHTFPFLFKACAYLFALGEGKQAHAQVWKLGFGSDVYVNNSLIHFYSSCGRLDLSRKVFDGMDGKSLVSWNSMIDGFVVAGEFENALKMFVEMQSLYEFEFEPDRYTLQSLVMACAGLRALCLGMWVHAYVLRKRGYDVAEDVLMHSSLIDMYCKCGSLGMAKQVFRGMVKRDVNTWNSMILGLGIYGQAEVAMECFSRMVGEGIVPNSVTFVGILSACNHKGMVEEGKRYFDIMIRDYKVEPVLEHYGCLVDLFARAGLIQEALDLVSDMPIKPDRVIWRSLLDACCKKNASIELSEDMAKRIFESNGDNCSGAYVLLSRVYAYANKWNDVGSIRKLMNEKGITKEPGSSSIEIDGVNHEFFAGDTTHPQTKEIYEFLNVIEERIKLIGYKPDFSQAPLVDEFNREKGCSLRLHSERLAIAFGLLNVKPGVPIRIFKNLRVCNDCHNVTKLISCIFEREIIVRDRVRFHHFEKGSCSCKDYW